LWLPEYYETNSTAVKVDNANRTAILDQEEKLLHGAAEDLGKENNVHMAKVGWLCRKDT
jgi:hypothetical protein